MSGLRNYFLLITQYHFSRRHKLARINTKNSHEMVVHGTKSEVFLHSKFSNMQHIHSKNYKEQQGTTANKAQPLLFLTPAR